MRRRHLMLGSMWVFIVLAFLAGGVVGAMLPLLQRATLQNDVAVLEKRLSDRERGDAAAQQQIEELTAQVASLETSAEALGALNSQLTSEVASLQASLQAQSVATPVQDQSSATGGTSSTSGSKSTGSRPVIVEWSVSPTSVAAGGAVTLEVKTKGATDKATIRIDGPTGSTYDYTFSLKKVSTEGSVSTWRSVLKAPTGTGTYRCIAAASHGSRRTTTSVVHLTVN